MISALQKLSKLLGASTRVEPKREVNLAVVVLLLEVAKRDGEFSSSESDVIERMLTERFGLDDSARRALFTAASEESAALVQLHPYTDAIATQLPIEDRVAVVEMLWEVAFADGMLDPQEDALIRRLGSLLHVEDRERVLARMRVLDKLGKK